MSPATTLDSRQAQEELAMAEAGQRQTSKSIVKATEKGLAHTTPGGQQALKVVLEPLSQAVTQAVKNWGNTGRKHGNVLPTLSVSNPDVLSYLALRSLIDCAVAPRNKVTPKFNSLSGHIGYEINSQLCYEAWKKEKPGLYKIIRNDLKERSTSYTHTSTVMHHALAKYNLEQQMWPKKKYMAVGAFMLNLMASLEIIEIKTEWIKKNKSERLVYLSPKLIDIIVNHNDVVVGQSVRFGPTLIPPVDWEGRYGGGYHTPAIRPVPLIKPRCQGRGYWQELESHDLSAVYSAVNHLQHTRWRINEQLLEVMEEAWSKGRPVGKLPDRHSELSLNLPPKPADIDTNDESRKAWKIEAGKLWSEYKKGTARLGSLRIMASRVLGEARRLSGEVLFLPWQLDFRGRVYPLCPQFSPQGPDYIKALFSFAEGKPIDTEEQAEYLAVTGPGHYGFDKVSIAERVEWVKEREDDIIRAATDPYEDMWWADADNPWQFLSWCFEWAGWLSDGPGFVSHIPCPQDGSCNGLQHFAAMMRDASAAAKVNLTPSEVPSDVYQTVADELIRLLEEDGSEDAQKWLGLGIDRKAVKRQVMTLPYGATRTAFQRYFLDWLTADERVNPFAPEETFKACVFVTNTTWTAVNNVLEGAMDAMAWLQGIAKVVAKTNRPLNWTTPAGLPVQQAYRNTAKRQIQTEIAGKITKINFRETLDTISLRQQAQGVAPNFVHSMDAAHLMMTVNRAKALGINSLAMVHDSYATHAADSPALGRALREAFVEMYRDNDVLADFIRDVSRGLPDEVAADLVAPPVKGDLEIEQVLESRFFFA